MRFSNTFREKFELRIILFCYKSFNKQGLNLHLKPCQCCKIENTQKNVFKVYSAIAHFAHFAHFPHFFILPFCFVGWNNVIKTFAQYSCFITCYLNQIVLWFSLFTLVKFSCGLWNKRNSARKRSRTILKNIPKV